ALQREPHDPRWWRAWAALGHRTEDWAIIAAAYQGLAQRASLTPAEYAWWARALRELGDLAAARRVLAQGVRAYPDSSLLWQDRAVLAEAARDWDDARVAWARAWALAPHDPATGYGYARVLLAEQPAAAVPVLREVQALGVSPWSPAAHVALQTVEPALASEDPVYLAVQSGRALARLGHWALAQRAWTRAVYIDPARAAAWAYLAQAYAVQGQLQRAEGAVWLARRIQPQDPLPALTATWLYSRLGRPYHVLRWARRAWSLRPDDPTAALALAQAEVATGTSPAIANTLLRYVTQQRPQDPDAWLAQARFGLTFHLPADEVEPALVTALRLAPHDPRGWTLMGRFVWQQGELGLAQRYLTEALQRDPGWAEAHLVLAWVLLDQGNVAQAWPHAQAAYDLTRPDDPLRTFAARTLARLSGQVVSPTQSGLPVDR
ncbi:MAG: tetratricopeptide repeat protein, partial [Chloroflexi bacterium]|nr:tetratricopeptide repeat protein [Chloroflexota bacterium]